MNAEQLEQFIMINLLRDGSGNIKCQARDLRALFDGKVLVPVSLPSAACVAIELDIENMINAAPLMQRLDGNRVWETALNALAASQEQS